MCVNQKVTVSWLEGFVLKSDRTLSAACQEITSANVGVSLHEQKISAVTTFHDLSRSPAALLVPCLTTIRRRAPGYTGPTVSFVNDQDAHGLEHLILVPGHGVTITESLDGADRKDEVWFLLDYQKDKDVPRTIVGHIKGGLDELNADESALLLFSGEKA